MSWSADEVLPLFPLQTVLFPGGTLPLQIFEVRYLDMVGRCHREGLPFGVVTLTQGHEVQGAPDGASGEAFAPVGTLAHIVALERPQSGLLRIRCEGGQRFRLGGSQRLTHGLWVGQVAEQLAPDAPVAVPEDLQHVSRAMQDVLTQWAEEAARQGLSQADLPVRAPYQLQDCGWLANRWCELLPLLAAQKQQLMALDNPFLRLELVADVLEREHGLPRA
ncbi:LON peptidase substrate-binding domain-containing protein [Curvibacter sp. RS43]|uniref:LON peptidase substrate-binding domain-containing protein n=1 Tax=Curvibacter microcysteis TaxID=3026419 RepID=UPI0023622356|nr:LON peptidase substrate-binding domain-containing protein [Curvibacter sp. RS43]MDD0811265.1 LON peptidase substrate-binding domain-containing protein [Curvibacter sp. RS43]